MSAAAPALIERAVAVGLGYILSRQADDGSWTDWALPPGPSTAWTTAYIGVKLSSLPPDLAQRAAPRLAAAARWLAEHALPDGGWGYNALVGSDADSTAHALLFLASRAAPVRSGRPSLRAAYARLAAFQNDDGGFCTYLRDGPPSSWNASHPDVTPVALRALLAHPERDSDAMGKAIRRATAYVLGRKTTAGLWHSFWWRSCLYGTEANLAYLHAAGMDTPPCVGLLGIEPHNAFEAALLLSSLLYSAVPGSRHSSARSEPRPAIPPEMQAQEARALVARLLGEQQPDGSWPSAPVLRITRRDCYEPWACADAGPLFADPQRLFTTATVVHGLARAYHGTN